MVVSVERVPQTISKKNPSKNKTLYEKPSSCHERQVDESDEKLVSAEKRNSRFSVDGRKPNWQELDDPKLTILTYKNYHNQKQEGRPHKVCIIK